MAEITIKTDYPEEVHKVLSETIETEISKIQYSLSLIKMPAHPIF
jgi:hypothetical protein